MTVFTRNPVVRLTAQLTSDREWIDCAKINLWRMLQKETEYRVRAVAERAIWFPSMFVYRDFYQEGE